MRRFGFKDKGVHHPKHHLSSPTMSFSVTKSSQGLVVPYSPTPPSGLLPLSRFDRLPMLRRLLVRSIHVFEKGEKPADHIRLALSKALVHYYPLAGRLVESDQGELQVCCNGEGVWFVEAAANCTLAQVNHLTKEPLMIPIDELLTCPPEHMNPDDTVIAMIQVTKFKCGGFVVCLAMNHSLADGVGMGQFLKAVGDMARGLEKPTVNPIWCREAMPNHLPPEPSIAPTMGLEMFTFDIPLHHINQVKNQVMHQTGRHCSTFDVVVAKLWQCRTQAIQPESGSDQLLIYPANARHQFKLHHVLPQQGGYYGNCLCTTKFVEQSEKICSASLVELLCLVLDEKEKLPDEFSKWIKGEVPEQQHTWQRTTAWDYNFLLVSDWRNLGFNEVDYGWGAPIYASALQTLQTSLFLTTCVLVRPPAPKQGVRVISHCIKKEDSARFHDKMMN